MATSKGQKARATSASTTKVVMARKDESRARVARGSVRWTTWRAGGKAKDESKSSW